MKKIFFAVLVITGMYSISFAQIAFKTGNAEMETNLNSMNVEANVDLGKFKANLSLNYGVPAPKIDYMFSLNMQPAEVFLALEIANITQQPCDNVVEVYKKSKAKGWGAIAKEMGIKPGSAEFHALKGKTKGDKGNKGGKGKKGEKGGKGAKGKK